MKSSFRFQDMFYVILNALIVVVAYRVVIEGREDKLQPLIGITVCTLILSILAQYFISVPGLILLRDCHPSVPWVSAFFCAMTANILWLGNFWILAAAWALFVISDIAIAWRLVHLPPLEEEDDSDFY